MPLKLNVGLSKKIGQPDFGSLGASCYIEVELDASLLQHDLEAFHRHVKNAFTACRQSVNDELGKQCTSDESPVIERQPQNNGNGQRNGTNGGGASKKQLDYANQLAGQINGLGVRRLEGLANKMFVSQSPVSLALMPVR